MSNLQITALAYGATTLAYLVPTYIEGERTGGQWSPHRIAGLVFCLFWPLLTVVVLQKATAGASKPKFVFVHYAVTVQPIAASQARD
jgi:predicted anti-sigma-YlaC factor YlaD